MMKLTRLCIVVSCWIWSHSWACVSGLRSPSPFSGSTAKRHLPGEELNMVLSSPEEKQGQSSLHYPMSVDFDLDLDITTASDDGESQYLSSSTDSNVLSLLASMDVRRFDTLVHAGPMDFKGIVSEVPNENLDWNTTIFYTVQDPQVTARLRQRFGKRPLWPDVVIRNACATAIHLSGPARQYTPPPEIVDFINRECEFKNEHADGSFTDHLGYCSEYCARYMNNFPGGPSSSPNVLFLHSICGVGTNLFPLEWSKIPRLEELLTPHESLHIQAFPCMLRLLFCELVDVLWDIPGQRLPAGISITAFHGKELTLAGDDFWMHLNYHLIHLLDFLPNQNFEQFATTDSFTRLFLRLHELLRTRGKLIANVRLDRLGQVPGLAAKGDTLPTWEYLASKANQEEMEAAHKKFAAQMRDYSRAIDHDLSYQLHWD